MQKVFEGERRRAGIVKKVSIHALRHSFATHLLKNGKDQRYIQELFGHTSARTTQRYTHVSTKNIQHIQSTLDRMDKGDCVSQYISLFHQIFLRKYHRIGYHIRSSYLRQDV
ncbi:tyrosine-type recombinase/integrase [Paenibacillus sp. 2003]|uniref:tyrosine-type recombinase/integrase n=1 Tax=Paenibacillus TaxID=44249 RepID=UPI00286BCAD0|nr:tyrosine-type recombinase/integrase [Paenibacillus sp. 2003]